MLSEMYQQGKHELTESALFYLLRRQSKDFKQLNHYFDQYFSHSRGDIGEDFETTKVMFETLKKLDKCVVTGANSLSGLHELGVKTADTGKQEREYIHTASRRPTPANIAFAAGILCRVDDELSQRYVNLVSLTKPMPSPKTPLVESPRRMSTVGFSRLMS
jgi:hypothetical protein